MDKDPLVQIEEEYTRVTAPFYAERDKQAAGEPENLADFYEGYRKGLSFAAFCLNFWVFQDE